MSLLPDAPTPAANQDPLYNIGAVTRMTGISMATLRAWERRYDFPQSGRTAGGHRLYSEKDVMRLRWVKARIDDGMQTAQAIQALYHQEENGQGLGISQMLAIPTSGGTEAVDGAISGEAAAPLERYKNQLILDLLQRDLNRADQTLGEALASSSPEKLILQVIAPAISEFGHLWENKEASVATEHMATNYLRQRLLMWMLSGPPHMQKSPILLACAPNEWHEGSLLVLGALLRRRRWPVIYLGQAVPLSDLASFTRELRPSMVLVVAMTADSANELVDWPQWMPEAAQSGRPIFGYGGRIFSVRPEWQLRVPGVFLGNTFQDGLNKIERLLG